MLFQTLHDLAHGTAVTLTASRVDADTLRITVFRKPKEGDAHAGVYQPLTVTATPEILDERFATALKTYAGTRLGIEESLAQTEAAMKNAAKEAAEKETGDATSAETPAQPDTKPKGTSAKDLLK